MPTFVPTLMPTLGTLGTYFCAYFYIAQPQTFNLFELLWQSEGFNPNPIELNTMYYVKTIVPTFVPTLVPTLGTLGTYFCAYFYIVNVSTFSHKPNRLSLSLFYLFGAPYNDLD